MYQVFLEEVEGIPLELLHELQKRQESGEEVKWPPDKWILTVEVTVPLLIKMLHEEVAELHPPKEPEADLVWGYQIMVGRHLQTVDMLRALISQELEFLQEVCDRNSRDGLGTYTEDSYWVVVEDGEVIWRPTL